MNMEQIFTEARLAGITAGNNAKPIPMTVMACHPITNEPIAVVDVVSEGVCGFAWISMKANTPENRKFISWGKKNQVLSKCSEGFWIWVHEYNQSMARKEAYAYAFANVLQNHGIKCYASSKMD